MSNVWSFDPKSKRLAQVTKFTDFDVKSMDAAAGVVVFEQAGYIHKHPQLERAVEEAMKLLQASPVKRLTTEPPPPNWGKRRGGGS